MKVADMQIWLNNKIKLNNLNLKPLVVDSVGGEVTLRTLIKIILRVANQSVFRKYN